MERTWNSNEKIARTVTDPEANTKHFVINGQSADELWESEAREKYNQRVDDYVSKLDKHQEYLEQKAKQFNDVIEDLEIKAIGNNMIVMPYTENPFQHIKRSESGLIIDLGGLKPEYKSNETGDIEEEEQFIHVGEVFDVGPDCKYIQEGDVVMWTKPSEMPIPFYAQNMVMINEGRVLCVINSNLTDRFREYKKSKL